MALFKANCIITSSSAILLCRVTNPINLISKLTNHRCQEFYWVFSIFPTSTAEPLSLKTAFQISDRAKQCISSSSDLLVHATHTLMERARVQVRSLLWDADDHESSTFTIADGSTSHTQAAIETLSLQDILHTEHPTSSGAKSGAQQLEHLLNNGLEDPATSGWNTIGSGGRNYDFNDLVLPPIHEAIAESARRAVRSGAPIADVLNAISPLTGTSAKDTELQIQALSRLTQETAASADLRDGNESSSKRRKVDGESTRTLPRPTRKGGKKQQAPALLPPLLAPLHNPPVDARVVPSMNPDRISGLSELKSPLGFPGQSADARTNTRAFELQMQPESNRETLRTDDHTEEQENHQPSSQQSMPETPSKTNKKPDEPNLPKTTITSRRDHSKRVKWTTQETQHLIDGVERFGIGNWKKILKCEDYSFQEGRNSIDLKDRFRTCFPDEYRQNGSQKGKVDSVLEPTGKRRGRGGRTTVELEKLGVKEHQPFPKQDRRQRTNFTQVEDESLLQGYLKYPSQWKKIQMDPELGLQHRTRTDLRDRFRNRYPQRFKEAGYVHKAKNADEDAPAATETANNPQTVTEEPIKDITSTTDAHPQNHAGEVSAPHDMSIATITASSLLNPQTSGSKDEPSHSLRLLTSGFHDFHDGQDFDFLAGDDDEDDASVAGIHLNRTIFDWADQNKLNNAAAQASTSASTTTLSNALRDTSLNTMRIDPMLLHYGNSGNYATGINNLLNESNASGEKTTISATDQYHMNPLDAAQKLPGLEGLVAGQSVAPSASVPLSKILNDR
jgi:hypothetical protein